MASFDVAYDNTKKFEGGYVAPEIAASIKDPGGETYKGVARNYNETWPGWVIIDRVKAAKRSQQYYNKTHYFGLPHNYIIDDPELEKLHKDHVKKQYWSPLKLDLFKNQSLANYVFDISYGSGPGTAAKSLQVVLGVTPDGVIGLKTLDKLSKVNPQLVFNKLKEYRTQWLKDKTGNKSYYKVLENRNDSFFFY